MRFRTNNLSFTRKDSFAHSDFSLHGTDLWAHIWMVKGELWVPDACLDVDESKCSNIPYSMVWPIRSMHNAGEIGRQDQRMDINVVWRFSEGCGRLGKVESYCSNVVGCAPTTVKVKWLTLRERWDEVRCRLNWYSVLISQHLTSNI